MPNAQASTLAGRTGLSQNPNLPKSFPFSIAQIDGRMKKITTCQQNLNLMWVLSIIESLVQEINTAKSLI